MNDKHLHNAGVAIADIIKDIGMERLLGKIIEYVENQKMDEETNHTDRDARYLQILQNNLSYTLQTYKKRNEGD